MVEVAIVVVDPKEDLVHRSLVEVAFQEDNLDNQNLEGETCVAEEDEIHQVHQMEEEGIDNYRSLVEEVGIDALVGKLEVAAAVVEEQ